MSYTETPKCPRLSDDLLEYLNHVFPDRAPSKGNDGSHPSEASVWFEAGCVHTVRHLRAVLEEQRRDPFAQPD